MVALAVCRFCLKVLKLEGGKVVVVVMYTVVAGGVMVVLRKREQSALAVEACPGPRRVPATARRQLSLWQSSLRLSEATARPMKVRMRGMNDFMMMVVLEAELRL